MAQNTLLDLNNHLFAQLERLGDESLTDEQLKKEVERSRAINGVAKNIIDNADTLIEGIKTCNNEIAGNEKVPEQFRLK